MINKVIKGGYWGGVFSNYNEKESESVDCNKLNLELFQLVYCDNFEMKLPGK